MDCSVDTKKCTNCGANVLSNNYITHSLYCQRNLYLCSKCQKPVRSSDREEHDLTNHVTIKCDYCPEQFEKWYLNCHLQKDCLHRRVKCVICGLEVFINSIEEHEDYCGSRTEKCTDCKQYVMLKYKTAHINSDHVFIKLTDESGPSASWRNGRRILGDFIPNAIPKKQKFHSNKNKMRSKSSKTE